MSKFTTENIASFAMTPFSAINVRRGTDGKWINILNCHKDNFSLTYGQVRDAIDFLDHHFPKEQVITKTKPSTFDTIDHNGQTEYWSNKVNPERLRGMTFRMAAISGTASKELVDTLKVCCSQNGRLYLDKDLIVVD